MDNRHRGGDSQVTREAEVSVVSTSQGRPRVGSNVQSLKGLPEPPEGVQPHSP